MKHLNDSQQHPLLRQVAACVTVAQESAVLVALSGGADSVALLRALLQLGVDCQAVHCNFHLRGEESMRDEHFVRDLCRHFQVPLQVRDFDVRAYQLSHGGSVEMACRELRYNWFEQMRQQLGCSCIAVAHHADDQVETFFLNLMRGAGVKGLAGMAEHHDNVWRPMLSVTKAQVLDYLEELGQDYVTDSTNTHNLYSRNRLRNVVLPALDSQFPAARQRIADSMDNLRRDSQLLERLVAQRLPDPHHIALADVCCDEGGADLLFHRVRQEGFNWQQCVDAVRAGIQGHSGRTFASATHLMYVNRQSIDIEPIDGVQREVEIPIDLTDNESGAVRLAVARGTMPFSPLLCDGRHTIALNASVLSCKNVVLRHWRRGDRMAPYGMHGTKLLSDLFNDLKLSHAAKRDVWLMEADGDIIWVLGLRASSLYPVLMNSTDYLLLTWKQD